VTGTSVGKKSAGVGTFLCLYRRLWAPSLKVGFHAVALDWLSLLACQGCCCLLMELSYAFSLMRKKWRVQLGFEVAFFCYHCLA